MSNEYPPRPTEMCEPVIRGEMVASDVYDFYINNKLKKAIDEYWKSKYPTFAKGRIKRMRTRHYSKYNKCKKVQNYIFRFMAWDFYPPIHRWNRH